jgi:hypothetical protein
MPTLIIDISEQLTERFGLSIDLSESWKSVLYLAHCGTIQYEIFSALLYVPYCNDRFRAVSLSLREGIVWEF